MKHMNKAIVAVAVATVLFSGSALAMGGNPENPNAATHNWQLDELRQSVNNQFSDVNNRIDQIQAGSSFDASDIYDRLDTHDKQIGDLNTHVNGLDDQVSNIGHDVNELKDQVNTKVDKNDFLKDQQKQNDRMDSMQERIDNNSGRLDAVEVEQQTLRAAVSYTQSELDKTNDKLGTVEATANEALNKAEVGIRDADQAKDIAIQADSKAQQALDHNNTQDNELARLDCVKADASDLANVDNKATDALNAAENALHQNSVQDAQIAELDAAKADRSELKDVAAKANEAKKLAAVAADIAIDASNKAEVAEANNNIQDAQIAELQLNKADRSELEDVAIKADGALAGAIENRNQIDAVKEDLAYTNKQVTTNKNDIADLKNQNGVLNNAVANAQDTANTASAKADKAQNTADKAVAGVNSVKNDVKVVSRDVANNSIRIQRNEERIDGAYAGIYDNRKNIEANRQAVNRNSQEIQKLNKNFSDLKNTVDANRKRAAAGIAGVAAMANIPEVNSHQTFSVGVGVGGFDGQQAVAVGASARVNDNLTVKASVAANNEEVVWGAGAAIGW